MISPFANHPLAHGLRLTSVALFPPLATWHPPRLYRCPPAVRCKPVTLPLALLLSYVTVLFKRAVGFSKRSFRVSSRQYRLRIAASALADSRRFSVCAGGAHAAPSVRRSHSFHLVRVRPPRFGKCRGRPGSAKFTSAPVIIRSFRPNNGYTTITLGDNAARRRR